MSLFDQDKVNNLIEKIVDTLRPIGVTVPPETVNLSVADGHVYVMMMGMVREDALAKADEDQETKAQLNQMLADQNRQQIEDQRAQLARFADQEALEAALFGDDSDECPHENVHEGLCLDCGTEIEDDDLRG